MPKYDELTDKHKAAIDWKIGQNIEQRRERNPSFHDAEKFNPSHLDEYIATARVSLTEKNSPEAIAQIVAAYEHHLQSSLGIGSRAGIEIS